MELPVQPPRSINHEPGQKGLEVGDLLVEALVWGLQFEISGRFGIRGSWSLWVEAEDSRPAILVLGIFFTIDNLGRGGPGMGWVWVGFSSGSQVREAFIGIAQQGSGC